MNYYKNDFWLEKIRNIILDVRNSDSWDHKYIELMRTTSGTQAEGMMTLGSYAYYVRRFTQIICNVASKVPDTDSRFWSLAVNLYDELGGNTGIALAHGKLIEMIRVKPDLVSINDWERCTHGMISIENEMVNDFMSLPWPLNLFALGPGTESISDLFLIPIESWSAEALKVMPNVEKYFQLHRPEVEHEHEMVISSLIADELSSMDEEEAWLLLAKGEEVAKRISNMHLKATCQCFFLSNKPDPINRKSLVSSHQ
jgi:hypothetical protein